MTVSELIEMLEDYDGEMEVRVAIQPSWPLAAPLLDVKEVPNEKDNEPVAWIVTGAASEYAPEGLY